MCNIVTSILDQEPGLRCVCQVTAWTAEQLWVHSQQGRNFCLLANVRSGCGAYPTSNRYPGPSPVVKRPELPVNDSPPSSADVKNEWGYTSSSPICFHGVDKETSPLLGKLRVYLRYYTGSLRVIISWKACNVHVTPVGCALR